MKNEFWRHKSLEEMTQTEWESLCDGCGRCCLVKLQDDETDEVFFTRLSCELLDVEACRCEHYDDRFRRVPGCLNVRDMREEEYTWLPESCAYRRLSERKPLADWHPLLSGNDARVHEMNVSVRQWALSEASVDEVDWQDYIIDLPKV